MSGGCWDIGHTRRNPLVSHTVLMETNDMQDSRGTRHAFDTHDGLSIVMLDRFRYVSLISGVSDRWLASSMLGGRERNGDG